VYCIEKYAIERAVRVGHQARHLSLWGLLQIPQQVKAISEFSWTADWRKECENASELGEEKNRGEKQGSRWGGKTVEF